MAQGIFDRFFGSYEETARGRGARQAQARNRQRGSATGIKTFDRSVHKANIWLKDLMTELGWASRDRAYSALRATVHAIRDTLPVQEAVHFAAEMPLVIRGMYFENWVVHKKPVRIRSVEQFYDLVLQKFGRLPAIRSFDYGTIAEIVDAVFAVLSRHIAEGELKDIQLVLHKELKSLIPIH